MRAPMSSEAKFRRLYVVTRSTGCTAEQAREALEASYWRVDPSIASIRASNIAAAEATLHRWAGRCNSL